MTWNPRQYLKFASHRLRPALDLIARIDLVAPRSICDLGCGTGAITQILADRWPDASITGVDESSAMLEQAAMEHPERAWRQQRIAEWEPDEPVDLIFSNAALHWLGDHATLFPKLMDGLVPGGVLAVQMPRNFDAPSHTLIAETARTGAWSGKLEHLLGPSPTAAPSVYHGLLAPRSASLDIWETEYLQVLTGPDPVKEWTKGTWLMRFLEVLEPEERSAFEADYARRLQLAYPTQAGGETLFPFRRLFLVAQKP